MKHESVKRKSGGFELGDTVKINPKNRNWYGGKKTWFITHIYKNGDLVLREIKNECSIIERYEPKDLIKV